MAHRIVAVPLCNRTGTHRHLPFFLIGRIHRHLFINVQPPFMPDARSGIRAENEPCRIQGIPVKKRILLMNRRLQRRIIIRILRFLDLEIHMKLRSGTPAVLFLHMIPAVGNRIGYIRQKLRQLFLCHPLFRILRMVVVTIHHQNIRLHKIILAAVIFPVFCAHMIKLRRLMQFLRGSYFHPVRIKAVLRVGNYIGCMQNQSHSLCLLS